MISLIFVLFSPFASAQSPSIFGTVPPEQEWPAFAQKIDKTITTLSEHDQKVIQKIQEASLSNNQTSVGYLMSKQPWKNIHDKEQKRFWAAVVYVAFNYANEVGCDTRNLWFLGKSRLIEGKSTLIKISACQKQVRQNLIVGGVSRNLHDEITKEYCEVFRESWTSVEKAALAYAKANSVGHYLCKE